MGARHSVHIEAVCRDLRSVAKKEASRAIMKAVLLSCALSGVFFVATKDNALIGPKNNLPMFLAVMFLLIIAPPIYFKLWQYAGLLRSYSGTVVRKRVGGERVPRGDRTTGYVNRMSDMVAVNVMYVTVNTDGVREKTVKMLGNHLFSLAQSYYQEGDAVEKFAGARYPYNQNAQRRLARPMCLYCGYLGASRERECGKCGCLMLDYEQISE
jgi:hypothetical protein